MHKHAEYGLAAHWLYEENKVISSSNRDSKIESSPCESNSLEDEGYTQDEIPWKYSSIKVGHPVLRVEGSQLLAAVVVRLYVCFIFISKLYLHISFLEGSPFIYIP